MTIAELLAALIKLPPERRAANVLLNGSAATVAEFARNGDLCIKLDATAAAADAANPCPGDCDCAVFDCAAALDEARAAGDLPPPEPPGVTSTADGLKAYAEGVNAGMTAARIDRDIAIGALYGFRNEVLALDEALALLGAEPLMNADALAREFQALAEETATGNPSGPDYKLTAARFADAAREWARCREWMAAAHCHRMAGLALAGQAAWEGYLADPKTLTRLLTDE